MRREGVEPSTSPLSAECSSAELTARHSIVRSASTSMRFHSFSATADSRPRLQGSHSFARLIHTKEQMRERFAKSLFPAFLWKTEGFRPGCSRPDDGGSYERMRTTAYASASLVRHGCHIELPRDSKFVSIDFIAFSISAKRRRRVKYSTPYWKNQVKVFGF